MVLLASCERNREITLATNLPETALATIGGHVADVVSQDENLSVTILTGEEYNGANNIALIEQGKVDMAISSTVFPAGSNTSVRTVLPLYPEIIVVLYDSSLGEPESLIELLRGRRVGVGPANQLHSEFVVRLLSDFGVPGNVYTPVFSALEDMRISRGEMDIFVTIAGADRTRIEEEILAGAQIYPLGDYRLAGLGSRVDGYLLQNPGFQSFIIPKNSIGQVPKDPVLTLAIPITLIAHEDMPAETVYKFVEEIFDNANHLARLEPMLGFLSYRFDTTRLNFSLHAGTQRYLARDEPGFLERYAEVMALAITLALLVIGALGSVNRVIHRRKKDRIDNYYQAVEAIARQDASDSDSLKQNLKMLDDLKSRAIEQLRHETLRADESFLIFLSIVHDTADMFRQKLRDRTDIGIDEIE